MVDNNVNVVNHSNSAATGTYTSDSAFADYIIQSCKITFISSAATNSGSQLICNPATGLNVISVASIDSNKAVSSFSNVGLEASHASALLKPTLGAPGGRITGIPNVSQVVSGTSFAAPIVTGIVAILMEEFPILTEHPEMVMSLLTSTCSSASGQYNLVDDDIGFGIVNYTYAREAFTNMSNIILESYLFDNEMISSQQIYIPVSENITVTANTLYNSNGNYYSLEDLSYTKTRIQIKNSEGKVVCSSSSKSNFAYLRYVNINNENPYFTLELYIDGSKVGEENEEFSFCIDYRNKHFNSIGISSGNYLDELPTFTWTLDNDSDLINVSSYKLVCMNSSGGELFSINNIKSNSCMLTKAQWCQCIAAYGAYYKVSIYAVVDNVEKCILTDTLREPDDFKHKVQIKPNEWGFEGRYWFESEGIKTSTLSVDDMTISTRRLRCGYIENSYIILSPKRQNAGKAYFEMNFDKPVYSYMFGITLWSSNEGLTKPDCTAVVEIKDKDGVWHTDWDLLTDLPNGFSIRSQQVDRYITNCSTDGIYGLRFVTTAPATGDRNSGRLCIDDIVLSTNPNDLDFFTTFYY